MLAKDETLQALLGSVGADPIYEVDSLSAVGATAGTVTPTFSWDGVTWTMPALNFNATAAQVQAAVQAAVGGTNELMPGEACVCSGGPLNVAAVTIRFQGAITGPVTAQTVTNNTLVGAAPAFTRTTQGQLGLTLESLIVALGNNIPANALMVGLRGSDGKMGPLNGVGIGNGIALQVYLPETGGYQQGAPASALHVEFQDTATGKLASPLTNGQLQIAGLGTPGSPAPASALGVGGADPGGALRYLSVDANGNVGLQSAGAPGVAAPTRALQIAGVDPSGLLRAISASTSGALATQDASAVPEVPLSINGQAMSIAAGVTSPDPPHAPLPLAAANQSYPILPDSNGASSINGIRGQVEVVNYGNVDVCVCFTTTAVWGAGYLLRPGGSLAVSYSGPVSAITPLTTQGQAPSGAPSALLYVVEWA